MTLPASTKVRKHIVCSERIKSWPVKERPRERLLAEGPARLSDAELLAIQRQIVERIASARKEIAREREAADRLAHDIDAEVEALILGAKPLSG